MPFVVKPLACLAALLLPFCAVAQENPSERARDALSMLHAAAVELENAGSARNRVRALTSVIQAYEEGLDALRSSLRHVTLREAELSAQLTARDAEIASLLLALQRVGAGASPVTLLHPAGPEGSLRAGLLLAQVTPVLKTETDRLRADLEALQQLQVLQSEAAERLQTGLKAVQDARTALSEAIADRTPLPKAFLTDPVREAILVSSADTLDAFASGLDELSAQSIAPPPPALEGLPSGSLTLPVRGQLVHRAGAADAAGVRRPGMLIATEPLALVSASVPGTLRYVGPLLDYGNVVILEPQADILFILSGLDATFVQTGDVVEGGAPLGLMGDSDQKTAPDMSTDGDEGGAARSETLYIEVRKNNQPEDPSLWFRTDKDG